jgi:hypothetical protein
MNIDTWAVVMATALGPLAAVMITMWRSRVDSVRDRQLHVFRTLMATRRLQISGEHVNALNLIEVEFYKKATVLAAWQKYREHLNKGPDDEIWHETKDRILAILLSEMAKVLKFHITGLEIFRSGYAPSGWAYREMRQNAITDYLFDLSRGAKTIPISVPIIETVDAAETKVAIVDEPLGRPAAQGTEPRGARAHVPAVD